MCIFRSVCCPRVLCHICRPQLFYYLWDMGTGISPIAVYTNNVFVYLIGAHSARSVCIVILWEFYITRLCHRAGDGVDTRLLLSRAVNTDQGFIFRPLNRKKNLPRRLHGGVQRSVPLQSASIVTQKKILTVYNS